MNFVLQQWAWRRSLSGNSRLNSGVYSNEAWRNFRRPAPISDMILIPDPCFAVS